MRGVRAEVLHAVSGWWKGLAGRGSVTVIHGITHHPGRGRVTRGADSLMPGRDAVMVALDSPRTRNNGITHGPILRLPANRDGGHEADFSECIQAEAMSGDRG